MIGINPAILDEDKAAADTFVDAWLACAVETAIGSVDTVLAANVA
ncbi:hypothetical protein LMG8526_1176 [Lactococcus lactis subsp. lactis]|nr:hypothetical protein LMG8526_1176 [Lactococcus lactis subsp. lactis]